MDGCVGTVDPARVGLELDELMLLQHRPVMLTSPVVFIVK